MEGSWRTFLVDGVVDGGKKVVLKSDCSLCGE